MRSLPLGHGLEARVAKSDGSVGSAEAVRLGRNGLWLPLGGRNALWLDARASVGPIYWECAVRAFKEKAEVGRGYLELAGCWKPMKL